MSSASVLASSPASGTSAAASVSANGDPRLSAVIAILTIIGIVLIGVIVFITVRLRRGDTGTGDRRSMAGPFHGTSIWEREHPATRITPFDTQYKSPTFNHIPGSDMRIAHRRPDGAWHFADSRTPFTPEGVSDLDNTPSPMSAASSRVFPFSSHYNSAANGSNLTLNTPMTIKEQEIAAFRLAAAQPRNDPLDDMWASSRPLPPPPPAYQRHSHVG